MLFLVTRLLVLSSFLKVTVKFCSTENLECCYCTSSKKWQQTQFYVHDNWNC